MTVTKQIDPDGMPRSPAFAQGVVHHGGPTVWVGGQNGIDADGALLEGFAEQCAQAFRNLLTVLDAAGSGPEHVLKLTIQLHADHDAAAGFGAAMPVWGDHRTAISVLKVAGFAREGVLVEVDAVAAIPA